MEEVLGREVEVKPSKEYKGQVRLIVPTVQTTLLKNESLKIKVIILDEGEVKEANLYLRSMGSRDKYEVKKLYHVARGVYNVAVLGVENDGDFEYHIKAVTAKGKKLYFPASAPNLNQTVIITE